MFSNIQKAAVIIPCYNEENSLEIEKFNIFLEHNPDVFLLFVNDGSKDNTIVTLKKIEDNNLNAGTLSFEINKGKAEAVRQGIIHLSKYFRGEFVGYFDADLSTPLETIKHFIKILESPNNKYQMVIGSRVNRLGATIKRKRTRHYLGRILATVVSVILHLSIYDSQCGAKVIDRELATLVFNKPFISKWLFDIELLSRLILTCGYNNAKLSIYEYPLEYWSDTGVSKIKFKDFLLFPFDLIRIHFVYYKRIKKLRSSEIES